MARFTRKRVMIGLGVLAVLFLVELALHRTHLWTRETHIDLGSGRLRRETAILWPTRIPLSSRIEETRFSRMAEELGVAAEYPTHWCLSDESVHVGFIITRHRLIASTRCGRTQDSLHKCAMWMDWMDRDALDVLGLRYSREEKRETVRHLLQLLADGEKARAVEFVNSLYRLPASHLAEETEQGLTAEHLRRLWGPSVGDEDIARVENPDEVHHLDLSRSNITDQGLALLSRFVNLERLDLMACRGITDAGIAHLAELRELRWLSLDGTRITDESIGYLTRLERIEHIGLVATGVTFDGVKRLQAEIPGAALSYHVSTPGRAYRFAGIFTIVVLAAAFILRARRPPGTRSPCPLLAAFWLLAIGKASISLIQIFPGVFSSDPNAWLHPVVQGFMMISITYMAAMGAGRRIGQMRSRFLQVIASVLLCVADLALTFWAWSGMFVRSYVSTRG